MDCERVQEEILESLIEARPAAVQAIVDAHLVTCATCAAFAVRQTRVDAGLREALAPPHLSPLVRAVIRERTRHQASSAWPDFLPDAVHFASCALVTVMIVALLPFSTPIVLTIAAGATIASHALLTTVQNAWDAADDLG
jgi:predicted anti-sigma-YlaC factor YlaD